MHEKSDVCWMAAAKGGKYNNIMGTYFFIFLAK